VQNDLAAAVPQCKDPAREKAVVPTTSKRGSGRAVWPRPMGDNNRSRFQPIN